MKKILSLLLAVLMLAASCALAEGDEIIVATVNGEPITYEDIRAEYEYNVNYYASYGITDEESLSELRSAIVDAYVQNKVMEQKVRELGLPVTSSEDLRAVAQAEFDDTVFSLITQYGAMLYTGEGDAAAAVAAFTEFYAAQEGKTLEDGVAAFAEADEVNGAVLSDVLVQVHAFMEEYDFSFDAVLSYYTQTAHVEAVKAYISENLDTSEESIRAYFDQLVASDEAEFTESPESVEYYVASGYGMPLFIPEGYRYIKHILVLMDSDDQNAMYSANNSLSSAQSVIDELAEVEAMGEEEFVNAAARAEAIEARLTEIDTLLQAEDADIDALTTEQGELNNEKAGIDELLASDPARLYQAQTSLAMAQSQIDELKTKYQPRIDEIYERLADGEDFTSLILELGEDPGMLSESGDSVKPYLVYENTSGLWEESFAAAAVALEEGEYTSEAVWTSYGAHIILYESAVPSGPVDFETVKDSITEEYVETRLDEEYAALLDQWTGESQIETWPERLAVSEEDAA